MEWLKASVYPKGGWRRAGQYVLHRLTRLPDPPHRIARGIFAGVFISFTPLFGLHFFGAAFIAILMRGNVIAALLGTFFGNPLTFPLIAVVSVQVGHIILGTGVDAVPATQILSTFAYAGGEVWSNFFTLFIGGDVEWGRLRHFYFGLFKPYLIGGIGPGLLAGLLCYYLSLPVISAYQRLRQKRRRDRADRMRNAAGMRLRAARTGKSAKPTNNEAN